MIFSTLMLPLVAVQQNGPVMRQVLIVIGLVLLGVGVVWPLLARLGLGHLPGDISVQRPGFRFYAPLGSGLLVSIVLSIVLTLVLSLWRR